MKLQNKVAVITGGSSGIGLATARRFVAEGARQSELDQAKTKRGGNVTAVQGDVANLDDLDRLYRTVASRTDVVDIVFANAGFVELLTIDAVTPEHFDKTININLRGLLFTVQKALPLMKNASAGPTSWRRQSCSWGPMTAASSRASTCRSMEGWPRSSIRPRARAAVEKAQGSPQWRSFPC